MPSNVEISKIFPRHLVAMTSYKGRAHQVKAGWPLDDENVQRSEPKGKLRKSRKK